MGQLVFYLQQSQEFQDIAIFVDLVCGRDGKKGTSLNQQIFLNSLN